MAVNGIRQLDAEHLNDSMLLNEYAFQFQLTGEQRQELVKNINPDQVWGYYAEGVLAAKLELLPLQVWLCGKPFLAGGIGSVATWPEYRERGMVKHLLKNALMQMKQQGRTISLLHPFSYSFYRKYGWENFSSYKKYEMNINSHAERFAGAVQGRICRTEEWRLLDGIYEQFAKRFNGPLIRNEQWWTQRLLKQGGGHTAVYINEEDQPSGYIRYRLHAKEMDIYEYIALNEAARRGIGQFISRHRSMSESLKLSVPLNDNLPFFLEDPRFKQELVPYGMVRIVDALAFLAQYPFIATGRQHSLTLHLYDDFASWNEGIYHIEVNEAGLAKIMKSDVSLSESSTNAGTTTDLPSSAFSCPIQAFSAMFIGSARPAGLAEAAVIRGDVDTIQTLESLLPDRTTYLLDFF